MYFNRQCLQKEHVGTNKVKLIAGQACTANLYKNLRSKLLKCCANIYFKRCLWKKILPKYVNIKVAMSSRYYVKVVDVLDECVYFILIWKTLGLIKLN
jgi:hypothetical protein